VVAAKGGLPVRTEIELLVGDLDVSQAAGLAEERFGILRRLRALGILGTK